ncbi:MAG: FKBP-type peptidyl-prolyl cis-trans isomerase [Hyphomonadaceae bacterium]
MIRTSLYLAMTAALLAACSQAPEPEPSAVDLAREEIDAATAKIATQTQSGGNTASDSQDQPIEETDLTNVFEGMIPWDANRDGLVTTESGLQIHVLNAGDSDGAQPSVNDSVSVNYEGRLASDGSTFDSSFERGQPAQFGVTQVIPGWTEALQLMRPGDDWLVYLPSNIAYGERGTPGGPIGPNADLVFRVVLEDIIADNTPGSEIWAEYLPWDEAAKGIVTTDSGLQYIVRSNGDSNGALVTDTDTILTDFEIRLANNGQRLESSYAGGATAKLPVNRLFPGWQEAIKLMRPGDDFVFRMTPLIAFGAEGVASGQIPEGDVIMRVDLKDIIVPQVSNSEAWDTHTPWNSESADVIKSENGVEYVVIESGDEGGAMPTTADTVEVYYEGRLVTGETFDSAYARGESIEFGVTGVIKGWTDTLQKMRPGDRWLVYIPADQAYGDSPRPGGIIKPGDDLIFEMQLVGVR